MEYVNLGRSGLKVSRLCLGCMTFGSKKWREWVVEEKDAEKVIASALDLGINFFDTADMYSDGVSEQIVGKVLRKLAPRDAYILATKVYFPTGDKPNQGGLSRKHIFDAIDGSLKRLGMDYVDLYQIHRFDYETPVEETLRALNDLVRAGKVRYIGASSMYAWQFTRMLYTSRLNGWEPFISMQNHYNLIYREEEREMLPLCRQEGIGVIPWSPLARGFLAGNRSKEHSGSTIRAKTDEYAKKMYYQEQDFAILEHVGSMAEQKGVLPIQIAMAWVLNKEGVTSPIIGVREQKQLDDLTGAFDIHLSSGDLEYLEEPYLPKEILGHD
jgi:aryl-alcohol dehydrogenase-like predicted oxidoreductase